MSTLRELVDEREGMRIAEIGAAGGNVLRMFPRSQLTAIDRSASFLDRARDNLEGYDVTFLQADAESFAAMPTGFDRVLCVDVLEHAVDPRRLLEVIERMLAPGGRAIITVPNDPLIDRLGMLLRCSPAAWVLRRSMPLRERHLRLHTWSPSAFRALLNEFFDVVAYEGAPSRFLPLRACFACHVRV